jgi:cation-transporting ATPase 13A2
VYGENSIRIHLTPIFVLFFREVLSPFYIFQVFSCALWYYDEYYYYASCIVFLSAISILYSLYSIRQNERSLRDIIHHAGTVTVFRKDPSGKFRFIEEEVRSEDLVPGDVIAIKNMSIMQCDAVLLNGNVIVNESMLTGESVPVTKTALSGSRGASVSINEPLKLTQEVKLSIKDHSRHIIFSGTQVIQTRYYENEKIRAVVLRTGFNTTKGELVRSILHPKPVDFRFNNDTYKYVGALAGIAFLGMIYSITIKSLRKNPPIDIIKRSLDIITIAVPPALPGALTAGLIYAQNRLRKQKIYCISPRTINICGTINTFVFDKTGTLTEDGLDLKCVLPVNKLSGMITNKDSGKEEINDERFFGDEISEVSDLEPGSRLLEAMTSCHSITRIHGDLAGDPLDCKMFEFTKWDLIEPSPDETDNYDSFAPTIVRPHRQHGQRSADADVANSYEIGIIKQFPFSSGLQRMSVVVKGLQSKQFVLYAKGSPEKIAELSKPESLPRDFQRVLTAFTREGYRVIGVAYRPVDFSIVKIQRMERDKLEKDLVFLGIFYFISQISHKSSFSSS